ncbi:hypothetical protein vBBaMIFTN5_53 [Bordetella phage vB_BaM-IFTN5]|nr:hypothetical protein vBBaMIFTN4_50 [Bordetella phage vB_BaM-IFTN4]UOK17317.1 hypothetical protein vBBaMIFTN5_53 [Bordetella phage vB_BaM-IFTN5]
MLSGQATPSPLETQVAASGARVGCDWCPNFRPQDTRPVDQADSKRERLYAQEVEIQDKQGNVKSLYTALQSGHLQPIEGRET